MNPGMATMPKACFQPHFVAMMPPRATPIADPRGMEAFHRPVIRERFSMGYMAEIIAVPPGAYPASPTPTPSRVRKSWGNVLTKAASAGRDAPEHHHEAHAPLPAPPVDEDGDGKREDHDGPVDGGSEGPCLRVGDAEVPLQERDE